MTSDIEVIITGKATKRHPYMVDGLITIELTQRQVDVFSYIAESLESLRAPTYREIGEKVELRSASSIQHIIRRLKENGLIESAINEHRSLRLTTFGSMVWKHSKEGSKK